MESSTSKDLREAMDGEMLHDDEATAAAAGGGPSNSTVESEDSDGSTRRYRTLTRRKRLLGSDSQQRSPATSKTPPTSPDDITASPTEVSRDMIARGVNDRWVDNHRRNWWKHSDESHRYTIGSATYVYRQPKKLPLENPTLAVGQDGHTYHIFQYKGSDQWGFPIGNPNRYHYPFILNDFKTKYSSVAASRRKKQESGEEESDPESQSDRSDRKPPASSMGKARKVHGNKSPRNRRAFSETRPCRRTNPFTGACRKKFRRKAGTNAIRQIKQYQGKGRVYQLFETAVNGEEKYVRPDYRDFKWTHEATRLMIPKATFQKLVREIAVVHHKSDLRFTVDAVLALQTAAEAHLVEVFQDANMCAIHAKRGTLMYRDMRLATKIRRDNVPESNFEKWEKDDGSVGCFVRHKKSILGYGTAPSLYRTDGVPQGRY